MKINVFLTDPNLAYIVLHFQAAYERRNGRTRFRAIVVCGTGRGTARLLKTRLENEIKSLSVLGYCNFNIFILIEYKYVEIHVE